MSIALQDPISQFHIHDLPFIIIYYQTFNVTMKLHLAIAAILSTTIDGGGITVVDPQQVVVSDSSQGDDPCPLCPKGQVLSNPDYVFDNESI